MDQPARTPLYDRHVALGARMVPFAGWAMPVQYPSGILAEHRAVRDAAGLFDVSHMGELSVVGSGAREAVGWLCANDPSDLVRGQAMYTPLCARDGGTIDDAILYCREPGRDYLFIVNAGNREGDQAWMQQELAATNVAAQIRDESRDTALLAVQGPAAEATVCRAAAPAAAEALRHLGPFTFMRVDVGGVSCLAARTGYTGEDGYELACAWGDAVRLWDLLLQVGAPLGLLPCGLGARDTLRLEAALALYGHELARDINPLEARLGRFVKLAGRAFSGAEALRRVAAQGPARALVGVLPEPPAIARAGAEVWSTTGDLVGSVTSGTFAPSLGRAVALALVQAGAAPLGALLQVDCRGRRVPAMVVALPFYRRPRRV